MPEPAVRFERITKRYLEVRALRDLSPEVGAGARHALRGERGGEEHPPKILDGIYAPDEGRLVIHRGQRRRGEWPLFPFYLVADVGGGIVRAPLSIGRQFNNALRDGWRNRLRGAPDSTLGCPGDGGSATRRGEPIARREDSLFRTFARSQARQAALRVSPNAQVPTPSGDEIAVSRFAYCRGLGEAIVHHGAATTFALVPLRTLVAFGAARSRLGPVGYVPIKPLGVVVLDAFGTPAWENMHRRTQMMFRQAAEFDDRGHSGKQRPPVNRYAPPSGAVAVFLSALAEAIREDSIETGMRYEITLIGHSMGAIVATEMVRTADSLPWRNIVFMGAAASVREFQTGVLPHLARPGDTTEFYTLALHPWAERRESHLWKVAPFGSLLEWIDAYFGHSETELDRMMGKYDNAVGTSFVIPPSVRGRFHIKAFGYRDGSGCGPDRNLPYQHGHFNRREVPYWRQGYWRPNAPGCEAIKLLPVAAAAP